MKIFAIRDEEGVADKNLAFLIYYENAKQFYIEIPDDAELWETPLLIESFLRRGERTVNAYWSRLWVQQRIIPSDRQNLGQILKENNLESYDEFELLMLGGGRCAQDNYYVVQVSEEEFSKEFISRYEKKIEDVIPLGGSRILVFFRNGEVKSCDVHLIVTDNKRFRAILNDAKLFNNVGIQSGGYGISWGQDLDISDKQLYDNGINVPLVKEDFINFISHRVVNTSEAADILGCSRQNIDDLIRRDKLHPIKISPQGKLFLKSEILERKW